MNKGELKWMINELNDKSTVIRGYAQLALEVIIPNGRRNTSLQLFSRSIR